MAKIYLPPSKAELNALFGDGSDGAAHLTVETGDVTLTSDKYYTDLTIDDGVRLTTDGFKIFCTGSLTVNGLLTPNRYYGTGASYATPVQGNAGSNGGNGGGVYTPNSNLQHTTNSDSSVNKGPAGGIGAAINGGPVFSLDVDAYFFGGKGGYGGVGGNGCTAGAPGTVKTGGASPISNYTKSQVTEVWKEIHYPYPMETGDLLATIVQPIIGGLAGRGGGGGGGNGTVKGGGGGGGGAGSNNLFIQAKNIVLGSTGRIWAKGQQGGNGGNGDTSAVSNTGCGGGGAGSGGGGGFIHAICQYLSRHASADISMAGAASGTPGNAFNHATPPSTLATNGSAGSSGDAGRINLWVLSTGTRYSS